MYGSYATPNEDGSSVPTTPLIQSVAAAAERVDESNMEGRPPMSMRGWVARVGVLLAATGAVSMSAKGLSATTTGAVSQLDNTGPDDNGPGVVPVSVEPVDITADAVSLNLEQTARAHIHARNADCDAFDLV